MSALKLNNVGDLDITGGRLTVFSGPDEIAQKIRMRLRFFRGEFFADERVGIPYFERVFIKNPSLALIQAIYREAIQTTPGISALLDFAFDFVGATRKLTITFTAQLQSGEILDFTDDFVLNVL